MRDHLRERGRTENANTTVRERNSDAANSLALDRQVFGENPLEVRESGHYAQEYVGRLVDKWDELIDWDQRADGEGRFFVDQLKARGVRSVLGAATGLRCATSVSVSSGRSPVNARRTWKARSTERTKCVPRSSLTTPPRPGSRDGRLGFDARGRA